MRPALAVRERCGAGHCARLRRTFSRSHHPTLDQDTTWAQCMGQPSVMAGERA